MSARFAPRPRVQRITETLNAATVQGAEIRFCGKPLDRAGNYMAPTLVTCATPETETIKVEMFGPVMSLLSFDTEDEAIALANDSDFGLGSGVFA